MQGQVHDTVIENHGDDPTLETNLFDQDRCFEGGSQKTRMIPKEKKPIRSKENQKKSVVWILEINDQL